MMGQQTRTESLFYYFRLEEEIPEDHLLRLIDHHVDFSFVRERLKRFYSWTVAFVTRRLSVRDHERAPPAGRGAHAPSLSLVHAARLW